MIDLYEMSNLVKSETGLDAVVFVSPKGNAKHGCRIKVSNSIGKMNIDDSFSISLHDFEIIGDVKITMKQMNAVLVWLLLNNDVVQKYWDSKITTKEMVNSIIAI